MKRDVWKRNRAIPYLLWGMLVAGIVLIAFPKVDELLQDRKQDDILNTWSDQKRSTTAPSPASASGTKPQVPVWQDIDGIPVLGTITIDKIGLHEPLLKGAGPHPLQLGIGVVAEDRLPGEDTNFVLAGHRSLTAGKHFNRLAELETGDSIDIETANGTYTYAVQTSYLVNPDDLSVLDSHPGEAELTLITCHPMRNPTHRLIVKAALHQVRRDHVASKDQTNNNSMDDHLSPDGSNADSTRGTGSRPNG